jgi:hypothetical protein
MSSSWLVNFYLMKKSAKSAALFCFGMWDVGLLYSRAEIPRTIDSIPYFWGMVRRKRSRFEHMETVIQTSRRLDLFLHESVQNFELLSNMKDQK